jgi:hypothetical protein
MQKFRGEFPYKKITAPDNLVFYDSPKREIYNFLPKISDNLRELFYQTLNEFLLVTKNFDYTLCYGSHLGSMLYEDMIPWDDDLDIFMLEKDRDSILSLINNHENLEYVHHTYTCPHSKTKREIGKVWSRNTYLYTPELHWDREQQWGFPAFDICWLDDYVDDYYVDLSNFIAYKKEHIFPAKQGKLGSQVYQIPNNDDIIKQRHPLAFDFAITYNWNHLMRHGDRNNDEAVCFPHALVCKFINGFSDRSFKLAYEKS